MAREKIVTMGAFGKALAEACGLEGRKVRSITLNTPTKGVVSVTAEILDLDAVKVITVLKHYLHDAPESTEEIVKEEPLMGAVITKRPEDLPEDRDA